MRIGIDFDNTIICYDQVFSHLAKSWQMIDSHFNGTKRELRDIVRASAVGDIGWMHLQGKAYGEYIHQAALFAGFKEFIQTCNAHPGIEIFIVSHKTEFGHFDENRVNLREASKQWLRQQGFFNDDILTIKENNIFFESTREEKIERIKSLACTHFIDDLIEVLASPLFPEQVERILFQPLIDFAEAHSLSEINPIPSLKTFTNWTDIKNAIFLS